MIRTIRLRLHVEQDLLHTRITPTSRARDPELAKKPIGPHALTVAQRELWNHISGGKEPRTWTTDPMTEHECMHRLQDSLPKNATATLHPGNGLSSMIEIIQKIKAQ